VTPLASQLERRVRPTAPGRAPTHAPHGPERCITHGCLAYAHSTPNEAARSVGQLDRRQQDAKRAMGINGQSHLNAAHWVLCSSQHGWSVSPRNSARRSMSRRARSVPFEPRAGPWDDLRHYESNNPHPPTSTLCSLRHASCRFLRRETPNAGAEGAPAREARREPNSGAVRRSLRAPGSASLWRLKMDCSRYLCFKLPFQFVQKPPVGTFCNERLRSSFDHTNLP